jgi:CheY-like chemotaxis protein
VLPVVLISGRWQMELHEKIREAGLSETLRILPKPFNTEELVSAVEAALHVPPSWGE